MEPSKSFLSKAYFIDIYFFKAHHSPLRLRNTKSASLSTSFEGRFKREITNIKLKTF